MESWNNITLNLRGQSVEIDGVGFSAIGRLELLTILQQRVRAAGVTPRYDTLIESIDQLTGYDLIVAADGLNSLVRRRFENEFGASVSHSSNKFAWYGTTRRFETLSQTFVATDLGTFNAHHYRYAPDMSTFLVECDAATWQRYGFADKTIEQSQAICEQVFAATLGGHRLVSNKSVWRNFPWIWNERWSLREYGADRRRLAFGAFFDRFGHAAGDRGRHRAHQGAGGGSRIFPPASRATRRNASRS